MKDAKQPPDHADFDFDKWSHIAKIDPEQFEKMRQYLIDNLLEQAPDHLRQRLEQQQWQIDQIRRQAANPLEACIQISQRMWHSVYGEQGLLMALQEPGKLLQSISNNNTGKIVSLGEFRTIKKEGP
ncbi:MAG: DUF3135 domain-containing protein [Nitrosomonas sp.]|nr:DUF3135 domain-containing protein [Nitrosomonas sp.]